MVSSESQEQVDQLNQKPDLIDAEISESVEQQKQDTKQSKLEVELESNTSATEDHELDNSTADSDTTNADVVISVHNPTMNHQSESSDDNKETLENNAISSPPSPPAVVVSSPKLSAEPPQDISDIKIATPVETEKALESDAQYQELKQSTSSTSQSPEAIKPVETNLDRSQKEKTVPELAQPQAQPVKVDSLKLEIDLAQERATSSPVSKLPKVSTGQWGSFLKRAVANVEQTLDKVIQETATSEFGTSSAPSSPVITSVPTDNKILSPQPIRPSSARLTMQERLAKAVGSRNSPSKSPVSSPRSSIDQQRPSSFELKRSVTPGISSPATPASDIFEAKDNDLKDLENLIKALPDGDAKSKIEEQLTIFSSLYVDKISTFTSDSHSAQEKINSLESKLKFLAREEAEFSKREKSSSTGLQRKLAEKEEQVALLLEEGQILSKNELKHMTTIKTLRARERESDRHIKDAQRRQENAEREAKKLRDQLRGLQDVDKKLNEAIKARTKAENENESLKKEKQLSLTKITSLENKIQLLKEKNDEAILSAQSKQLSEERALSAERQRKLSQLEVELSVCKEQHASEISELESRLKKETETKKEMEIRLENDIRTLETKVEHFRAKSEELSSGRASDNNANLLRQIEVLQAQHDIATQNWSGIEANLQTRISNLEQEAEDNSSRESYLRKKVKTLTENLKSVTNENESLNDQLDEVKTQLAKLNSSQVLLKSELSDAKSTAAELESTIETLKAEHDKKVSELDEKLKISAENLNQYKLQQQQRKKSNPIEPPFFGGESVPRSGTISPFNQRLSVDDTNSFVSTANSSIKNGSSGRRTSSKTSLPSLPGLTPDISLNNGMHYAMDGLPTHFEVDDGDLMPPYSAASETFRTSSIHTRDEGSARFDKESVSTIGAGPSIQLVNRMSRSIRSLESELANAKQDLARMELSRDEAVKDLSQLMKELEELNKYKAQVTELESKISEMSLREQTALEMLGEKSEQVQELRADVMDIKTMFQQQIEELVDRLAKAEKR